MLLTDTAVQIFSSDCLIFCLFFEVSVDSELTEPKYKTSSSKIRVCLVSFPSPSDTRHTMNGSEYLIMEKIEETKNNVSWYAEQQPTSNLQILNGTSHSVHSQPLMSETVTKLRAKYRTYKVSRLPTQ